ncbi:hypothetical protein [Flavivirga spongiicola]|uniref:Uncharacterized protein n=1 Tax=Flavivirga spongiicola TaxID=421621 RepID=A0ABU7XT98_9FLAO|nr:hypothetical protein [Flavivirga sp. MEBiC05379]MDO5978984.1 hypothetical protein [Flavivirga sp. MEBiC05379]
MTAETVFEVYMVLDHEEQNKLYDLVKAHFNSKYDIKKRKRKRLPDFSEADAMRYLIENVVMKKRKKP